MIDEGPVHVCMEAIRDRFVTDAIVEHVHLQAILTILRHLGRLSEVQSVIIISQMTMHYWSMHTDNTG